MKPNRRVDQDEQDDEPEDDGDCKPERGVSEEDGKDCFWIELEVRREGKSALRSIKSLKDDEEPEPEVVRGEGDEDEDDFTRDLRDRMKGKKTTLNQVPKGPTAYLGPAPEEWATDGN